MEQCTVNSEERCHDSLYDVNTNKMYVLQHKKRKKKRKKERRRRKGARSLNSTFYSSSKQSAY
jgi:rRNA processing protein Gar1